MRNIAALIIFSLSLVLSIPPSLAKVKVKPSLLAIVVGLTGESQINLRGSKDWVDASVGQALLEEDSVRTGADSSARLILIDDTFYKVGAGETTVLSKSLLKDKKKKYPQKGGLWELLYKKYKENFEAQQDFSRYGAVRRDIFLPDLNLYDRSEVAEMIKSTSEKYSLSDTDTYYIIAGAMYESAGFYEDANRIYLEGLKKFPELKYLKELQLTLELRKKKVSR